MRAYCFADGRIHFGTSLPKGALPIARGRGRKMRAAVEAIARRGYEPDVLLVPGVPEAANQALALQALEHFISELAKRIDPATGITVFTRAHRWPIEGQGKLR